MGAGLTSTKPLAVCGIKKGKATMTTTRKTTAPTTTPALEDLDLTPDGLADAPALQQDHESIVHTGNS